MQTLPPRREFEREALNAGESCQHMVLVEYHGTCTGQGLVEGREVTEDMTSEGMLKQLFPVSHCFPVVTRQAASSTKPFTTKAIGLTDHGSKPLKL